MEKSHTMATRERTVRGRHFSARFMATALRILSKIHISIYRWTGGIIGGRIFGNRMLLLTTTGRKTLQPRTKPVAYLTDGDAMIIVGGAAGAAKHPDWWLNLQSHPEAQVRVGRRRLRVSAIRALPEEQQRLWARYPAQHALFESMQKRMSREIPVVILRPLSESSLAHQKLVRSTAAHKPPVVRAINRAARALLRVGIRRLNPLMLSLAESRLPMLAVIHHRGRRSGRSYATPLGARPIADGFVIPLTFGERVDWFRNVQAAGGCVIRWKGANYPLIDPEVVDWATVRSAFYPVERVVMPMEYTLKNVTKKPKQPFSAQEKRAYRVPMADRAVRRYPHDLFKSAARSHDYLADLEQRLSAIKEMPALLIFGDQDGLVKLGWLARLERIFPRHRSIVMQGCHHFPQEYDAAGVATAIRSFWDEEVEP